MNRTRIPQPLMNAVDAQSCLEISAGLRPRLHLSNLRRGAGPVFHVLLGLDEPAGWVEKGGGS